jgi:hypothetical protein
LLVEIPEYNTSVQFPAKTDPAAIKTSLREKFHPLPVAVHYSWDDVQAASCGLVWANAVILRAKAMQYLTANPGGPAESGEWDHRFEIALDKFSVCSKAERVERSLGFGLMVFIIYTPFTWLVLLALAWIRYLVRHRSHEDPPMIDGEERRD